MFMEMKKMESRIKFEAWSHVENGVMKNYKMFYTESLFNEYREELVRKFGVCDCRCKELNVSQMMII